ncbi:MAG TPA: sigma-70 family RNA polymerase sigma factor [Thermoanaerobaculia bacterium]|nr:sigma-70 family RNA polymerase sigma factor [Thermoanaerobaculia bacterium]
MTHETATDPGEESPAALVAHIVAGDGRAEARLFSRYGRSVAILLDRHTNGRPEAEDLFQDTFRLALEKLRRGELREPEKLPGFLAGIARSLAIEHYRKTARRKTEPDSEAILTAEATGTGQLSELLARENAALVREVIRELGTSRDREILVRFYIAEEDKDRIAADHGLSGLQFNRVLHRARQRYKELLTARLEQSGSPLRTALLLLFGAILPLLVPLAYGMAAGARR